MFSHKQSGWLMCLSAGIALSMAGAALAQNERGKKEVKPATATPATTPVKPDTTKAQPAKEAGAQPGFDPAMQAKFDAASQYFNMAADITDPISGRAYKARGVIHWTGENSYVEEFYRPGPDGKEMKEMEISFTRAAKSEADRDKKEHEVKHEGKDKS